jgi:DNA-directed RNA polymerase specialized sigma24 family protein
MDEAELLRAAREGDPTAATVLWDAHGAIAYAFAHRVLGDADAAAGVAQEAFLIAHGGLPGSRHGLRLAILGATRIASFERVAGARSHVAARGRLSAAAARLRPQKRAALALAGLERLSYAEIAAVLGIAVESVAALLARARLRLHDELYGTALAAAAVRSPDCEDVLPVLGAAADAELDAADSAWADPHLARCPTCVRTVRALRAVAATYAAWAPAPPPAWLREAVLAELGADTTPPPRGSRSPAVGTLSAALLGDAR